MGKVLPPENSCPQQRVLRRGSPQTPKDSSGARSLRPTLSCLRKSSFSSPSSYLWTHRGTFLSCCLPAKGSSAGLLEHHSDFSPCPPPPPLPPHNWPHLNMPLPHPPVLFRYCLHCLDTLPPHPSGKLLHITQNICTVTRHLYFPEPP